MRALAAVFLLLSSAAFASGGYFRFPALHGDTLVFTAEGDLWKVPAAGGEAQRLTTHPAPETRAAISPDGQWLAFSASYEGPTEAYVMPMAGGVPRRLTWYGSVVNVTGWTPQGDVLVATRYFHPLARPQLVSVSPQSGAQALVPLENADRSAYLDAGTLVFTRDNQRGDNVRRYRGGSATTLWRFDVAGGAEAVALTQATSNASSPMNWKGRIAFLSDRDGVTNIWSMDRNGGDLRQHTKHMDFEVRGASISGDRVAYQLGADLRIVDLASGADRIVPIRLVSDFDQQRERWVRKPLERFSDANISASGDRILVVARGRIVTAGTGNLRRVDISVPGSGRVRSATFMPDGKSVLAVCDSSGENELWLLPADGSGPGKQLTRDADTTRWEGEPSPDGKWVAHHDRKRRLWLFEVATGRNQLLQQGDGTGGQGFADIHWSPDSSALAAEVALAGSQRVTSVVLYRVADAKPFAVTSPRYTSFSPSFSADGKWLWFLSNRHLEALGGNPWGERNMGPYFDKRTRAYAIALQPGTRFPFQPKDELEPPKAEPAKPAADPAGAAPASSEPAPAARPPAAKAAPIVWDGLQERLFEVPLAPGNYTRLASDGKRLWYLEAETSVERKSTLKSIAIDDVGLPAEVFATEVRQFALSGDGKKLFLRKWATPPNPGDLFLVDATAKPPTEMPRFQVKLGDWQFTVQPRDDWRQIFVDAWRLHRDWFYDAGMHGVDWPAARRKYEALLGRVTDRDELTDLMAQMSAELSLLHSQLGGGDLRRGDENVLPATLGAVYEKAADGVRIASIYRSDLEVIDSRPPLARPGVGAKAGDVIVSLDGRPLKDPADLAMQLRDKAGRQVLLGLRTGSDAVRKVVVTPAAATREPEFRRRDWEWQRRDRVEAASKGRFGYVHLRAMGAGDLADFAREFYPVADREGLIIDVRQNGGGNIDSIVIEKLLRRAWAYWQVPGGKRFWNMQGAFRGPVVVLIDAGTYSDGETFAEGIRRLGLATLVGKRTAGAGVWLSDTNRLVDGGIARAAEWGQLGLDGQWLIEGKGVEPDVEVDNPPHATFKGEDAQLAAAIGILEEKLAANPIVEPPAAKYPRIVR